jgi:hypothetical protein
MASVSMLDTYLKIALTLLAFLFGVYLKNHSTTPIPCDAHLRGEPIAVQSLSLSQLQCCSKQDAKFSIHRNVQMSLNERVFAFLPHPKSPVDSQLLVTGELKEDWEGLEDAVAQVCDTVYMQRSPTRIDQEHKCVALVRLEAKYASSFPIAHRNGTIAWPQHLTHQYQEDWIRGPGHPDHQILTVPLLNHIDDLVRLLIQEVGPPTDDLGGKRTLIMMVRQ